MRAANLGFTGSILLSLTFSCSKKESSSNEKTDEFSRVVATEADLSTCTADTASQVYWIELEKKFVLCDGSSFIEIKGVSGEKGEVGSTGAIGSTGPAGSPANSGVWVFDSAKKAVALLMDSSRSILLFSNDAFMSINLSTGQYLSPLAFSSSLGNIAAKSEVGLVTCSYLTNDCSGICYLASFAGEFSPIKGSVFKNGSSLYIASGSEEVVSSLNFESYFRYSDNTCNILANPSSGYPITTLYSFPEVISLPLSRPLSFGPKPSN